MNPCAATFKKIGEDQPVWWKNLVSDKEIVIQVRKNDSIDVYFNGGCILKGLKYNSRTQQFAARSITNISRFNLKIHILVSPAT